MADLEGNIPFPTSSNGRRLAEYARAQAEGVRSARGTQPLPLDAIRGYSLVSQLHWGGQGEVYEAIQTATKRRVAIKLMHLRAWSNARSRARFEQEMELLGKLKHPNIVAVHDGGVSSSGRYFFVMDLIDGEPLDDWLADKEATVAATLAIFSKVCSAVNAAHVHGIAHRDLKPSNIIMDASGEPYVLDFGLAKLVLDEIDDIEGDDRTFEGEFLGSIPWASPEQADCTPGLIDLRTDVYSLGIVLFRILTGHTPYCVAGPLPEVFSNIRNFKPPRPSVFRREIDDDVDTIVLKCLSKERERRYQTAGELGRDIDRYLSGKAIDAKRDSTWYVLSLAMKRHKRVVAAVIAFVSLLAIGLAVSSSLYVRSVAAERAVKRRFDEVQNLARSILFELDEKLRQGPTAAREFYVRTALEYLKGLAEESRGDPDLQELIATGYIKVADVQGNESYANLGDAPGAMQTLELARQVAEEGVKSFPGHQGLRRELATVYERIGDLQAYLRAHSKREALQTFELVLRMREALAEGRGEEPESMRGLSSVLLRIGNMLRELGRFDEAIKAYERNLALGRRWVALEPDNREAALYLVHGLRSLGDMHYERAELEKAMDAFRSGLVLLEKSATLAQDDKKVQHEQMRLTKRVGDVQAGRSEHNAALRSYELCEQIAQRIAADDPSNVKGLEDLLNCSQAVAQGYYSMGRNAEALVGAEKGLETSKLLAIRKAGTKGGQGGVAFAHMLLGCIYWQGGRLDEGSDELEEAVTIFQSLSKEDPDSTRYKLALASSRFHLGDIRREQALDGGQAEAEAEPCWLEARAYYEQAKGVMLELDSRQALPPTYQGRMEELTAKIAALDERDDRAIEGSWSSR